MGWVKSNKYVLGVISMAHKADLVIHGTFSNPSPSELSMQPQMMTEYGFKDSLVPLIKYETRWEDGCRDATEKTEYFIWNTNRAVE